MDKGIKINIIVWIVFSTLTTGLQAQAIQVYGLKIGPTYSNVYGPDIALESGERISFPTQYLEGMSVYVFSEWRPRPRLTFGTEAGYARRGFKTLHEARDAQNNPTGTFHVVTRTDYLSLIPHLKVFLPLSAPEIYLVGGAHINFLLPHKQESVEESFVDLYSRVTMGGIVGIGGQIKTNSQWKPVVEARFITDIFDSLPGYPRRLYNKSFELLLGINIKNR